jgi:hypothetical protein
MSEEQQALLSELRKLALETYREEYRDLSEGWRNLDTKAQGLGAIAGIFLAAAFAWGRDLPVGFTEVQRFMLAGAIVLLVATTVAAVLALQVRMVAAPPLGEETAEMVTDILQMPNSGELLDRVTGFYNDQITAWKDTNIGIRSHCLGKAARIQIGQLTLLLAAVLVAVLAIVPIVCNAQMGIGGGR